MDIVIRILQLLLSLAIIVILHELGHFVFAKIFKTRVEKFYLFFNPWFSIYKFKKGETEYGIGWIPLGGYVKIAGMIDESLDREQLKKPPQPYEFRTKPAWQRLLIMLAGVVVNFILALFIYAFVLFVWGEENIPMKNAKYGIYCDSIALKLGLQHGDKIIKADAYEINLLQDVVYHILIDDARTLTVERNGQIINIDIPPQFGQKIIAKGESPFISLRYPFIIDSVLPGLPAANSGLKKNDSIIAINSTPTPFFFDFRNEIVKYKEKEIALHIIRDTSELVFKLKVTKEGTIGVAPRPFEYFFKSEKTEYGFFESFPAGIKKGFSTLILYVKQFKLVFTKEGARHLGGFGTIGKLFPPVWDWSAFWEMTALLSIILAFMNILPIPALDGGHVLFLLVEIITRRKPSDKFLEHAQIVGMILLVGLLLYANGNDIIGCVGGR
ncbi:MAG: RIP metalloprotease RseP [Bacteroidia bacterium]|nr:RIP metalloprotease RseP [Bacteroidia bacterium]